MSIQHSLEIARKAAYRVSHRGRACFPWLQRLCIIIWRQWRRHDLVREGTKQYAKSHVPKVYKGWEMRREYSLFTPAAQSVRGASWVPSPAGFGGRAMAENDFTTAFYNGIERLVLDTEPDRVGCYRICAAPNF